MRRLLALTALTFASLSSPVSAQMTDAASIRPILNATKGNWVAVREFQGQDLVYLTHLETWRCGLDGVKYGINSDVADQDWELAECDESNPNAIPEDHLPYFAQPLNSVETIIVEIPYDDGEEETVSFGRDGVEIQ